MQRKAYVTGVAALLAALLAGCTGGSDDGGSDDNSKSGQAGTVTAPAQPGKYATLPEPCGAVPRGTLDALLPGVRLLPDQQQREAAYDGSPTLTFDTDRKVGCRWKVESSDATDHLSVDFERVVSYANAVSDDAQAEQLFAEERDAADLPEPAPSGTGGGTPSASVSTSPAGAASAPASGTPSPSASASASSSAASADLQPRTLDDLGDEAFLNDVLSSSGSTAKQRTITVAFRTSNVIVTLQYEEQPATVGAVPDSKEMQDKARKLASQLADALAG
ncbi:DUF3558 domain-containing protein [Streptomyces lasalocidi]|uniref:DUF3558 domain-containing protein n=1 Tax=Streptomyces lasalocidi TaxID=324833 RepID=A0A4U5WJ82_STRLS|nr:DUF3558 domain-containing protein [Streptomyces lasalocidi]TKT02115.1 DUF3558 domain-containing protein [Streptomyces lasalocidi]